jgi:hypothetical protein
MLFVEALDEHLLAQKCDARLKSSTKAYDDQWVKAHYESWRGSRTSTFAASTVQVFFACFNLVFSQHDRANSLAVRCCEPIVMAAPMETLEAAATIMNKQVWTTTLCVTFAVFCFNQGQAQYNYATLTIPGFTGTYPCGISGNNVVGYGQSDNSAQGFLYNGSDSATLKVPGSTGTYAFGIFGSNVVGSYYTNGSAYYGFLYNGTNYIALFVPGASSTYAYGMSGSNIVGSYYSGGTYDGFVYDGSTYTYLSVPGATDTEPSGISDTNIVGSYYSGSNYQGFVYNGSTYTTLNVPGATDTYPNGISGGNIVGSYHSGGGIYSGFLYNGSSFLTLSFPGATNTYAYGVSGNVIVGIYNYGNPTVWQGFMATPLAVAPAAPVFQTVTLSGGTVFLTWSSQAGSKYQLQFIPDLGSTNWTSLGNAVTATGTTTSATDSIANGPRRIYRVALLP